jgi:ribosomal-protein-alanine N-acetyltransferase
MRYSIKLAGEDDIRKIVEIENVSFPSPWTENAFRHEIENPRAHLFVAAAEDGAISGYYDMWLYSGEGHLLNICVAPEYRGKGLGKALLEHALATAENAGADGVYLEVRPSNDAAISLYEKYGFIQVGTRKGYYQDGEDALLYALFLGDEE